MARHIHKYKRFSFTNGKRAYKCTLPNCYHYIPSEFLEGKQSICWRCGNIFTIDYEQSRRSKPHCGCKQRKDHALNKLVRELGVIE